MMKERPRLTTARLTLRPFHLGDAQEVRRLAGDREIAATTATIPHPYKEGMAEAWISTHQERFERGEAVIFAITLGENGTLVGAIGLELSKDNNRAELGYWIGKPYWSQGYCTEAAQEVARYAFAELGVHRVHAWHMRRNPASGLVMQKVGMKHEGSLRQHLLKWGQYEDLEGYGLLKSEFESGLRRGSEARQNQREVPDNS